MWGRGVCGKEREERGKGKKRRELTYCACAPCVRTDKQNYNIDNVRSVLGGITYSV